MYSTVFTDNQTGFIAGGIGSSSIGSILKTTDAGNSWSLVCTGPGQYTSLSFPSANIGFSCSWYGAVVKTIDGGLTWFSSQVDSKNLTDIYFIDNNTGFTVGYNGGIFKTLNGGTTWIPFAGYYQNMTGVFFADANTGYICGNNQNGGGTILLKTTNTGNVWIPASYSFHSIDNLFFLNANKGFLVGMLTQNNPAIWKTTNGGSSWEAKFTGFGAKPSQIYFYNSNVGVVVAGNGLIFRTINGGENWIQDNSGTTQSLFGTCITNNGIGYASGFGGTLLKSSSFNYIYCGNGTHKVYICHNGHTICVDTNAIQAHLNHGDYLGMCNENLVPENGENQNTVKLFNNYPNPFNPSTIIRFYLPTESNAKLSIYDLTGKEIMRLVDNVLPAGEHEFVWNAADYASGIYYYKLEASDIKVINKMVLMK
jgi:photosystem II stability/assembly factor-like uncharacterized protein